jgi:Domain of unknown function (DUF4288)
MFMEAPLLRKWYLAVLVIASHVEDDGDKAPLVDLQYKLIHAAGAEAAYRRALELGDGENHDYENDSGDQVHWQFLGLNDLCEILDDHLEDGVEVYSQMAETDPREWVRRKEELSIFWTEANKHRTAREIIDGHC